MASSKLHTRIEHQHQWFWIGKTVFVADFNQHSRLQTAVVDDLLQVRKGENVVLA
jgi:hypothetical protein